MRYLIVLSILISIFIPKMQLGAFDFYKQWEKRENGSFAFCPGLYTGKVSNRNRPELLYLFSGTRLRAVLVDGETKDEIFRTGADEDSDKVIDRLIGVFDLNRDGYNEVYTGARYDICRNKYLVIDTKDLSVKKGSLTLWTTDAWIMTYNGSPADSVLLATGPFEFAMYSLPNLALIKTGTYKHYADGSLKCTGIAIDDFDKDGRDEIAMLFSNFNSGPDYSKLEFYDLETWEFDYEIDLEGHQYTKAQFLNIVDNNKDGYPDFIFQTKPDYDSHPKIVMFDGRYKKQSWASPSGMKYPSIGHFRNSDDLELAVIEDKNNGYVKIVMYYMSGYPRIGWQSESFDGDYYYTTAGDLTGNGRDDLALGYAESDQYHHYYHYVQHYSTDKPGFSYSSTGSILPMSVLSTHPNPFSDRLTINSPSLGAIYDLTGNVVTKLSKGKHTISTTDWQPGVYIVRNRTQTRRIVKLK